jgi:DNA-binding NarL/FixJ family response regulator
MQASRSREGPVRILLADFDPRVRQGLRALIALQPGFTVVGELTSKYELLRLDLTQAIHVVVLDVQMPELADGLELIRYLVGSRRQLVLAMSVRGGHRDAALFAGAHVFLEKGVDTDALISALRTLASLATQHGTHDTVDLADPGSPSSSPRC